MARPAAGWIAAGVGVLAAGAAATGYVAERLVRGRPLLPGGAPRTVAEGAEEPTGRLLPEPEFTPTTEGFGALRGRSHEVKTSDGIVLYAETDPAPDAPADAPTIVFCHGYALSLDSWHYQRKALRGRYPLVFWDQRGHGRSQVGEPEDVTFAQLGRDLGDVIDQVVPGAPVVLVGHSMGGMTVMELARQRPELVAERVTGVAFVATSAGGPESEPTGISLFGRTLGAVTGRALNAVARHATFADWGRRAVRDIESALVRRYSFHGRVGPELSRFAAESIAATRLAVIADFLPRFASFDGRGPLTAYRDIESLVLAAGADRMLSPGDSDRIVDLLPNAEDVVVAGAGHLVMLEKPVEVTEHLERLLDRAVRR